MGTEQGRAIHLAALEAAGRTKTAARLRAFWESGGKLLVDDGWAKCKQMCFNCKKCGFPEMACGKKRTAYLGGFACPMDRWPVVVDGGNVHRPEGSPNDGGTEIVPGGGPPRPIAAVNLVDIPFDHNAVSADQFVRDDGAGLVGNRSHDDGQADRGQQDLKRGEPHGRVLSPVIVAATKELDNA